MLAIALVLCTAALLVAVTPGHVTAALLTDQQVI